MLRILLGLGMMCTLHLSVIPRHNLDLVMVRLVNVSVCLIFVPRVLCHGWVSLFVDGIHGLLCMWCVGCVCIV